MGEQSDITTEQVRKQVDELNLRLREAPQEKSLKKIVVGYSIHQQADDTNCFIPHIQQQIFPKGRKFKNGCGDAGYGSEENYAFLEQAGKDNFFKYNTFHQEQHPPSKPEALEKLRFKSAYFPMTWNRTSSSAPHNSA